VARDRIIEADPRNDGKYRARVWDAHKLTGSGKLGAYRSKSGLPTEGKARAWCIATERDIAERIPAATRGATFGAEIDRWLKLTKLKARRRTYVVRCTELARVPDALRALNLRELDDEPAILDAFRATLLADGFAPNTVRQTMGTVAMVLDGAVNARRMSRNTARPPYLARMPRVRKTTAAAEVVSEVFTAADIAAVRAELPPVYRIAVDLMYGAGLRLGEACGLKGDFVWYLKRAIRVEWQWSPSAKLATPGRNGAEYGYGFDEPKHGSRRTVPVSDSLLDAINAHVATHGLGTEGTVMRLEHSGKPVTEQQWHDVWTAAAQRAGVSARWTAHDMRHAFGSRHYNAGVPATTVAKWLGHTLETFTRTYAHAEGEHDRPTLDLVASVAEAAEACTAEANRVPGVYRKRHRTA